MNVLLYIIQSLCEGAGSVSPWACYHMQRPPGISARDIAFTCLYGQNIRTCIQLEYQHVPVWLKYPHVHIVGISVRACMARISACATSLSKFVKKKEGTKPPTLLSAVYAICDPISLTGGWVGGVRGGALVPKYSGHHWSSFVGVFGIQKRVGGEGVVWKTRGSKILFQLCLVSE